MGGCSGSKERPWEKPWDSVNVGLDDELKGYTIPDDGEVPTVSSPFLATVADERT